MNIDRGVLRCAAIGPIILIETEGAVFPHHQSDHLDFPPVPGRRRGGNAGRIDLGYYRSRWRGRRTGRDKKRRGNRSKRTQYSSIESMLGENGLIADVGSRLDATSLRSDIRYWSL